MIFTGVNLSFKGRNLWQDTIMQLVWLKTQLTKSSWLSWEGWISPFAPWISVSWRKSKNVKIRNGKKFMSLISSSSLPVIKQVALFLTTSFRYIPWRGKLLNNDRWGNLESKNGDILEAEENCLFSLNSE